MEKLDTRGSIAIAEAVNLTDRDDGHLFSRGDFLIIRKALKLFPVGRRTILCAPRLRNDDDDDDGLVCFEIVAPLIPCNGPNETIPKLVVAIATNLKTASLLAPRSQT